MKKKIDKHPSIQYQDTLEAVCKPLEKLDINYFAHVNIDAKGQFSALGKQPEFVKLYFEKEYYNFDIHMAKSRSSEQYILWDTIERSKESKSLHDDFIAFDCGHTFTIVQENDDKSKDYFHFAGKLGNTSLNNQYLQNIDLLKMFILYFRDKISNLKELRSAYDYKFSISHEKGGYFTNDQLDQSDLSTFMQAIQLERIYFNGNQYLTKREFECLYWLSIGRTLDQIATILKITPRTINAHIKNIKDKLNCDNQFQLGMIFSKIDWVL